MAREENLTPSQWVEVLLSDTAPELVAKELIGGKWLPWVKTLLEFTRDSRSTLDLGSGRGENSAVLALQGKNATLLDWSRDSLDFSRRLFAAMNLDGRFCQADMTKALPFADGSFDTVFSCGVLEYFNTQTNDVILKEAFRVARRRVIMMVPNALSISYRVGKWYMESTSKWFWGGEVPAYTLKPHFRNAGSVETVEFSVAARHSLVFLTMPGGETLKKACVRLLKMTDHSKRALFRQGYLLVTVGDKLRESHVAMPLFD